MMTSRAPEQTAVKWRRSTHSNYKECRRTKPKLEHRDDLHAEGRASRIDRLCEDRIERSALERRSEASHRDFGHDRLFFPPNWIWWYLEGRPTDNPHKRRQHEATAWKGQAIATHIGVCLVFDHHLDVPQGFSIGTSGITLVGSQQSYESIL